MNKSWGFLETVDGKTLHSLIGDQVTIGSAPQNSICLKNTSKQHCILTWKRNKCKLFCLSSKETNVNGEMMKKGQKVEIKSKDHIQINDLMTFMLVIKESGENQDLFEDIQCAICHEVMHEPKIMIPCLHNFCSLCIGKWSQNTCPQCKQIIKDRRYHHVLNNIIQKYLIRHPERKRDPAELQLINLQQRHENEEDEMDNQMANQLDHDLMEFNDDAEYWYHNLFPYQSQVLSLINGSHYNNGNHNNPQANNVQQGLNINQNNAINPTIIIQANNDSIDSEQGFQEEWDYDYGGHDDDPYADYLDY